jgi:hypothetical protein
MIKPAELHDPWDAPLTQAQWDACKWMFKPLADVQLNDDLQEAA